MIIGYRRLPRIHSERMLVAGWCTVQPKRNRYGGMVNGVLTTRDDYAVDCRICMYRLGLYVPLVKLWEHQVDNMRLCNFQKEFFTWPRQSSPS
jgi:hypothetical protein